MSEGYPDRYKKVILMVSPEGDYSAIGGDTIGEGMDERTYPALEYLKKIINRRTPPLPQPVKEVIQPVNYVRYVTIWKHVNSGTLYKYMPDNLCVEPIPVIDNGVEPVESKSPTKTEGEERYWCAYCGEHGNHQSGWCQKMKDDQIGVLKHELSEERKRREELERDRDYRQTEHNTSQRNAVIYCKKITAEFESKLASMRKALEVAREALEFLSDSFESLVASEALKKINSLTNET